MIGVDNGEVSELAVRLDKHVDEATHMRPCHLAVNQLELIEIVRDSFEHQWAQIGQREVSESVHFVNDRLEVFELAQTFEDFCEFHIVNTTVAEDDSVHHLMVEQSAGLG